jgi:hypothetical protein
MNQTEPERSLKLVAWIGTGPNHRCLLTLQWAVPSA